MRAFWRSRLPQFVIPQLSLLAAALGGACVLHCAHQVAPSGGPADTAPPEVALSVPANNATRVGTGTDITFEFNEWVDPQSAEKSIAMFPPPPDGYDVRVKGRTLQVEPSGAWPSPRRTTSN